MKVSLLISQEPMKKIKGKRKVFQEEELVSRRGLRCSLVCPSYAKGRVGKENENEGSPKQPGEKDKI